MRTFRRHKKFERTLQFIEKRFGGSAQKDVDTYAGTVAQLANNYGDVLEELGQFITKSPKVRKLLKESAEFAGELADGLAAVRELKMMEEFNDLEKGLKALMNPQEGIGQSVVDGLFGLTGGKEKRIKEMQGSITHIAIELQKMGYLMDVASLKNLVSEDDYERIVATAIELKQLNVEGGKAAERVNANWSNFAYAVKKGVKDSKEEYKGFADAIIGMTTSTMASAEQITGAYFLDTFKGQTRKAKEYFADFGNTVLSILSQTMAKWALFGFGGSGGILGGFGLGGGGSTAASSGIGAGIKPYATGTAYVPHTGIYQLHKGEEVKPAHAVEGSGGGQQNVVVIQAWDAQDVMRNKKAILAALYGDVASNGEGRTILKKYLQ
jgi:hypothetical protein